MTGVIMLNINNYLTRNSIWPGIFSYVSDHAEMYHSTLTVPFTDDDLLKLLKKNAQEIFFKNEYDPFRKAITALRKGSADSLKKENLYRLCYALKLDSDAQAQELFQHHLHQNELSARSLDEFILMAALKLHLSWKDALALRQKYTLLITPQPTAPRTLEKGLTAEMYHTAINEKIQDIGGLICFLDDPDNLAFFSKTRNTQYLALFDDIALEILYRNDGEQIINLFPFCGDLEKETIQRYHLSLFGLLSDDSGDFLTMQEISSLCQKFEHVFMTYDNFCMLVQRKRPTDISSGTFMLNLLKNLLTDEQEMEHDFYVDLLDPEEFAEVCDDILIYFEFPALDPAHDNFERLLMDVYTETLDDHPNVSNTRFQELYLQNLRKYLRTIAHA